MRIRGNGRFACGARGTARAIRGIGLVLGVAFAMQIGFAVFGLPARLTGWLFAHDVPPLPEPAVVVVLGGGGIPSASGLLRTYYAANLGGVGSNTLFIVSLPAAGDPDTADVGRMRDELVMRGIDPARIRMEHHAVNTHQQAVAVRAMLPPDRRDAPLLVVTSPTHMRRALLCFRQAGFEQVSGAAAHGTGVDADLGKHLGLRYGFWNNLEFQARVGRELVALLYYRLKGWI